MPTFDLQPVNSGHVQASGQTQKFDLQPVQTSSPSPAQQPTPAASPQSNEDSFTSSNAPQDSFTQGGNSSEALATVGGMANAATSGLESGVDAALWVTDKLNQATGGLIGTDPKISQGAKNQLNQDLTAKLRSNVPGAPNDIISKSMQEHPIAAAAGKYGLGAGLAIAATPGKIVQGAGLGTKALDLTARAAANGVETAGMAGPNSDTQDLGFILGAASAPLGDLASYGITSAAKGLQALGSKVKAYLSPINEKLAVNGSASVNDLALKSEANYTGTIMKQNDANYQVIKDISGTINGQAIQGKVTKLYTDNGGKIIRDGDTVGLDSSQALLNDKQINVLRSVQQDAGQLQNMEQALLLRQYISGNQSIFQGKGIPTSVKNGYVQLKTFVDNLVEKKATEAGLEAPLKTANQFNQFYVQPLHDSGAVDRMQAVLQDGKRAELIKNLKPGEAPPPIDPAYSQAVKQVLPANPSPEKLKEVLSRLDPNGKQIVEDSFTLKVFKDIQENPDNFDKNGALIELNKAIAKYTPVLSKDSIDTLQGMKILLKEAGAQAKKTNDSNTWLVHHAGYVIGGVLGGAVGGAKGFDEGHSGTSTAIGSLAGIAAGGTLLGGGKAAIKGLAETQIGQKILRFLVKNPDAAKKVVGAISQGIGNNVSQKTGE